MKNLNFLLMSIIFQLSVFSEQVYSQQGPQSGASALANAYVRINPIYAYFYGDIESYVSAYSQYYEDDSYAVECAKILSQSLLNQSIRTYDPNDIRRRQEIEVELQTNGISPGQRVPTQSEMFYQMALQLNRLARILPDIANGHYASLHTPATDLEQMQIFAEQLFKELLKNPEMTQILQQMELLITEAAQLEYQILLDMTSQACGQ